MRDSGRKGLSTGGRASLGLAGQPNDTNSIGSDTIRHKTARLGSLGNGQPIRHGSTRLVRHYFGLLGMVRTITIEFYSRL